MNEVRWTDILQCMLQGGWNATFFQVGQITHLYMYNDRDGRDLELTCKSVVHKAMARLVRLADRNLYPERYATTTSQVPNENQEEKNYESPVRNDDATAYNASTATPVDADTSRIDPLVDHGPDSRIGEDVC